MTAPGRAAAEVPVAVGNSAVEANGIAAEEVPVAVGNSAMEANGIAAEVDATIDAGPGGGGSAVPMIRGGCWAGRAWNCVP